MPGQTTQTEELWVTFRDFSRGLANKPVLSGECLQFSNMRLDRELKATVRWGYAAFTSSLGTVGQGLFCSRNTSGTSTAKWLFIVDGKAFHWDSSGDYPCTPSIMAYPGGSSAARHPIFVEFGAMVIIFNIWAAPQKYTGTLVTTLGGSPPNSTCGTAHNGQVWAGSMSSNKVYMSTSGTSETWPALNYLEVGDVSDGTISLVSSGDAIYAFMKSGIYQITGRSITDFYVRKLCPKLQVTEVSDVVPFGEAGQVFLANGRLWIRNSSGRVDISEPVITTWDILDGSWIYNSMYLNAFTHQVAYFATQNWIVLYLQQYNASITQVTLVYDMTHKTWSRWLMGAIRGVYDEGRTLYFAKGGTFYYMNGDVAVDGAASIPATLQIPFSDMGLPEWEKSMRHVIIEGKSNTGNVTVYVYHRMTPYDSSYTTLTYTSKTLPCKINLPPTRFVELSVVTAMSVTDAVKAIKVGFTPVRRRTA